MFLGHGAFRRKEPQHATWSSCPQTPFSFAVLASGALVHWANNSSSFRRSHHSAVCCFSSVRVRRVPGEGSTASHQWVQGRLSASVWKAAVPSSACKDHWLLARWVRMCTIFSTIGPRSLLLLQIQTHWEDKVWHPFRGAQEGMLAGGKEQQQLYPKLGNRPATAGNNGHWSGSFIHTLLADVVLTCGKGASSSVTWDKLQLRKATGDSCLSKCMFVSKMHTSQTLGFSSPNVWAVGKTIYVKIKKSLSVKMDGSCPS